MVGNKGPCGRSVTPLAAGGGRKTERKRKKNLQGQDKGTLTEQQM